MTNYKNYTYEITQEDDVESPRTSMDNLGTIIFSPKYKHLGDKHNIDLHSSNIKNNIIQEYGKNTIIIPIYAYIHSGMALSTTPYHDEWDSGLIGFIVASTNDIKKEYNAKRISKKMKEKAISILLAEVEILHQYVSGDVWTYCIYDNQGEVVDSCCGFYGFNETEQYVKSLIDSF